MSQALAPQGGCERLQHKSGNGPCMCQVPALLPQNTPLQSVIARVCPAPAPQSCCSNLRTEEGFPQLDRPGHLRPKTRGSLLWGWGQKSPCSVVDCAWSGECTLKERSSQDSWFPAQVESAASADPVAPGHSADRCQQSCKTPNDRNTMLP